MNLREILQTNQVKTNELFTKLFDTSSGAVKTREKLFAELKTELELAADLEERHLFPVLRKHQETKDLVPDASKGNKELRAKLAELDTLPKDDEAFIQKLQDLKRGFQQYVRDEKKELLPAVFRAVSEEQVQEVAGNIENGRAEAEQARRDQAETQKAEARHEREQAEQEAAEHEAAARAQKAAERQARDSARQVEKELERTAAAAHEGVRRMTETAADGAQRTTAAVLDTVAVYRDAARDTGQDIQALAAFSQATTGGMTQIGSAWTEWLRESTSASTQLSQRLLRCRTMQELAETQCEFLAGSTRSWMEHNARLLQISRRVADEGLRALGGRLGH
jgi:hypothetical protein